MYVLHHILILHLTTSMQEITLTPKDDAPQPGRYSDVQPIGESGSGQEGAAVVQASGHEDEKDATLQSAQQQQSQQTEQHADDMVMVQDGQQDDSPLPPEHQQDNYPPSKQEEDDRYEAE
jgi:hypothetical protein